MVIKVKFPQGNEKHDVQPSFVKENPIGTELNIPDFDYIEYHGKHYQKLVSIKKQILIWFSK